MSEPIEPALLSVAPRGAGWRRSRRKARFPSEARFPQPIGPTVVTVHSDGAAANPWRLALRLWRASSPYWLAVAFPWSMWLRNWTEEPAATDIALTFAGSLGWGALASVMLRPVIRDASRHALLVALAVLVALGYGHCYNVVNSLGVWHRHLLPAWLATFGLLTAGIACLPALVAVRLTAWLRNAAVTVIAWQLVAALPVLWADVTHAVAPHPAAASAATAGSSGSAASRPDVYYLIVDGYARGDVLRAVHQFDNGEFLDALRQRGFFVASQARANYAQTRLSLPASLNMDYLPPLPTTNEYEPHHAELRVLRKYGRVLRRFRQQGYRYRHVGSAHFRRAADADEELYLGNGDGSYRNAFLQTTLLGPLVGKLAGLSRGNPADVHEFQFKAIAQQKTVDGPLFTFAHICCPHPPYVYGRHGRLPQPVGDDDANSSLYVEQLQYLNGRVLELIDAIDRTSGPGAVIVLQADHGSASLGMDQTPSAEQLFERMSIFSAYRVPEATRQELYPTITPVNSFRVLFNGLFGDNWPLLPDESHYSTYQRPFEFTDARAEAGRERGAEE